jgi:hypothetical protein
MHISWTENDAQPVRPRIQKQICGSYAQSKKSSRFHRQTRVHLTWWDFLRLGGSAPVEASGDPVMVSLAWEDDAGLSASWLDGGGNAICGATCTGRVLCKMFRSQK